MSGSGALVIFRSGGAARSESRSGEAVTAFVNGSQSTYGLSTTTSGIVCVTMRSMTCAIIALLGEAVLPSA